MESWGWQWKTRGDSLQYEAVMAESTVETVDDIIRMDTNCVMADAVAIINRAR